VELTAGAVGLTIAGARLVHINAITTTPAINPAITTTVPSTMTIAHVAVFTSPV
jgi:hypothetical protein